MIIRTDILIRSERKRIVDDILKKNKDSKNLDALAIDIVLALEKALRPCSTCKNNINRICEFDTKCNFPYMAKWEKK